MNFRTLNELAFRLRTNLKAKTILRERIAVSTVFLVCGLGFGILACRIPDIQRQLNIDEAQLGLAILIGAVGGVLGVANAGRICARQGSHRVAIFAGLAFSISLFLLSLAPNFLMFSVCFIAFGASGATMDVAMNINGVAVEKLNQRPIMSSLHGMFSLGGLVSAGVGWFLLKQGVTVGVHFFGGTILLACLLFFSSRRLLPSSPDPNHIPPSFVLPEKSVVAVGVIAFSAFACEAAMGDWSAIYLRKSLHQSPAYSALGYFAFALTMTATRFGGDAVLHKWGPPATLRICGLLTAIGMGTALFLRIPWVTLLGFGSVGLGMATVAPVAFGVGGRIGGDNPDHAISSVATMGYTAFLVGPGCIGFIAKNWSLRDALFVVVILSLVIVALSGHTKSD